MNIELIVNQEDAVAFGREFGGLKLDDLNDDQVAFAIDSAQGITFHTAPAGRSTLAPANASTNGRLGNGCECGIRGLLAWRAGGFCILCRGWNCHPGTSP